MKELIFIAIAYLIGSLSTSIILSKFMKFPDPRTEGSGNAGATNVLRNVGKNQAAMVLIGDMAKGFIAVILARVFGVQGVALAFCSLAAVAGHIFPVFFGFKGGKGVATALGSFVALSFWVGVLAIVIWVAVAALFRFSSLASLISIISSIILVWLISNPAYSFPVFLIIVLVIWKHMDNIKRLKDGTESKIQF